MKKLTRTLPVLLLATSLAACSGTSNAGGGKSEQPSGASGAGNLSASDEIPGQPADTASSGGKKKIVFSTFWPDDRFKEAKRQYEALHPNVEIELQSVDTDNAHLEANLEKFQTKTSAAMLAGKGPDLLEMDMLPSDDYVKHHLLEEIGAWMDKDPNFDKNDYFGNVLDGVRANGGLYGMPLQFFLLGLSGDESAIQKAGVQIDDANWSWSQFNELAKTLVQKGEYKHAFVTPAEYLLTEMVTDHYGEFVDLNGRKANFDSPAFTGLLQEVKGMVDDGVVSNESGGIGGRGDAYFRTIQINSPYDFLVSLREMSEHEKLYTKPHAPGSPKGGYFRTYRTIGINASSRVKAEAWDFLRFMMADKSAQKSTAAGFPISKKSYESLKMALLKEGSVKAYEDGPLHGLKIPVDKKKLDELDRFVTGATHAAHSVNYKTNKITDLITKESTAFFRGQKSADAVTKLIQNKATTYLNE
ncbi:ABC transporter substrate-binding protein [Cohnella sp. REN36]|uniref:ABC transporter substrate-binding protein n=1 Tax=Cohnella sp. REN36 TaxID=2887347 RepID=UPI001D14B96E|nr:ABC transporter substrate-binding protein [Cohnella sp. REN36]MCC3371509.1 ABC transporter substrate-binding protein [Cohnella sp. REN36]